MNDNIGEQVACGSNLASSQINEPVLSLHDMGTKKSSRDICLYAFNIPDHDKNTSFKLSILLLTQ